MSKHKKITDVSWESERLYPESVPHFLHWDLSYFWMLEKFTEGEAHHVPSEWQRRLEAWKHLLDLFLLGKLRLENESFQKPFAGIAEQYGLDSVTWLLQDSGAEDSDPIGVLSPTVLVRPLPDFSRDDSNDWPERPSDDPALQHFASLVIEDLPDSMPGFETDLVNILEDVYGEPSAVATSIVKGRSVRVPILKRLQWKNSENVVDNVDLLIKDEGGEPTMLPQCPNEGLTLLRHETDAPIEVGSGEEVVALPCPHDGCHEEYHEFALAEFFVWQRSDQPDPSVIVWDWQGSHEVVEKPEDGYPPRDPLIEGARVRFEWNRATLDIGGDRSRRYLELKFPGHDVERKELGEVLYDSLLIPGAMEDFRGYPVRQEWFEVLQDTDAIINVTSERDRVEYGNLNLRGWPMPISLTFDGRRVRKCPEVGIGRYPHPEQVPETWKWFRFFASGPDRQNYHVSVPGGDNVLSWISDVDDGLPPFFGVEESKDRSHSTVRSSIGVIYPADPASGSGTGKTRHQKGDGHVQMGVDFGTTNTVLYGFHARQSKTAIDAENNGIDPSQAVDLIDWFAPESSADPEHGHTADFLPRPDFRDTGTDPYIIPSAIWKFDDHALIRWGQNPPTSSARPETDFKMDRENGPKFGEERKAYLIELLSTYIPLVLKEAYKQIGSGSVGTVSLGFAFPLALGANERNGMGQLLRDVQSVLENRTGLELDLWSLSESRACIQAFGQFTSGETHLIADMGGGTLDVALLETVSADEYDVHQIGSLNYAGESFLDVITSVDPKVDKWEIRDSVRSGESQHRYADNPRVESLVNAFMTLALEFLRHMGEADKKQRDTEFPELILVGNGWHLIEAFSEEAIQIGRRTYFDQQYDALFRDMGGKDRLKPTDSFDEIPSSKHVVAIGVLKNAINEGRHELNPDDGVDTELSQLPAGRGMQLIGPDVSLTVPWYQLVGNGVPLSEDLRESQFEKADIDFIYEDKAPIKSRWQRKLTDIFDGEELPYPKPYELRDQITGTYSRQRIYLTKGPLQIILEEHWLEKLKKA